MESIFHRHSIRRFQDRIVEPEKTEKMLRAAMAAPSACNQQPWEYYVVTDPEKLDQLSKTSPYAGCLSKCKVGFVPCYRNAERLIAPDYAEIDLSASVENLLLEADHLGLGAVWLGIAPVVGRMNAVSDVLSIPKELHPFALIACGYPAEEAPAVDRFEADRVHYVE